MNKSNDLLQVINLEEILNPKPSYECNSIRQNPDLIKLQEQEPILFQEEYEKYVMKDGVIVYTREIEIGSYDWYEDEEQQTEPEIISKDEWEKLPAASTGELVKFRKDVESCIWKSRSNGIYHYSKWSEFPVYHIDEMFEKIDVPQLEIRKPVHTQDSYLQW